MLAAPVRVGAEAEGQIKLSFSVSMLRERSGSNLVGRLRFMDGKLSLTLDSVSRLARYLGWPPKPEKTPAPEYIIVNLSPERCIVAERNRPCHGLPGWEFNSLCGRKPLRWLEATEELGRLYGVKSGKK